MKVKILAFGIARDILGTRNLEMDLPEATPISGLKDYLVAKYPDFTKLRSLKLAVNQEYASDDLIITNLDEIVIIPPVSGG